MFEGPDSPAFVLTALAILVVVVLPFLISLSSVRGALVVCSVVLPVIALMAAFSGIRGGGLADVSLMIPMACALWLGGVLCGLAAYFDRRMNQ
jgi:hypothetical protein